MTDIAKLLADEAEYLLKHRCTGIPKEALHLPGPDYVDRVVAMKDRKPGVLRSMQALYSHGRLANTGYLSLLPVDQGVEHSGGASFAPNPIYFDPDNIVKLAIEGGCNAVASTLGVLSSVAASLCAQDSLHRQNQPQRNTDLSQHLRSDAIR